MIDPALLEFERFGCISLFGPAVGRLRSTPAAGDAELKACLMAEAEAAIDKLLATRQAPAEASLADIEPVVLAAGQQIAQVLTAELVA